MVMMPPLIIKLAMPVFPTPTLMGLLAIRLSPQAGKSLVILRKGVSKVGNPLSGKPDVELTQGTNESLREFHV
jgi:hypothetical protein